MKRIMSSLLLLVFAVLLSTSAYASYTTINHTLVKGEHFWKLHLYYNVPWTKLKNINSDILIKPGNFNYLLPGQIVKIPIEVENVPVIAKQGHVEFTEIKNTNAEVRSECVCTCVKKEVAQQIKAPDIVNIEPEKTVYAKKAKFPASVFSMQEDKLVLIVTVNIVRDVSSNKTSLMLGKNKLATVLLKNELQNSQSEPVSEQVSKIGRPIDETSSVFSVVEPVPIEAPQVEARTIAIGQPINDSSLKSSATEGVRAEVSHVKSMVIYNLIYEHPSESPQEESTRAETSQVEVPQEQLSENLQAPAQQSALNSPQTQAEVLPVESVPVVSSEPPSVAKNTTRLPEEMKPFEDCGVFRSVILVSDTLSIEIEKDDLSCEEQQMLRDFLAGDKKILTN